MTNWKFYGRRDELEAIKALLSRQRWFFCAISGRRRIGKTSLIREALQETRFGATSGGGALYLQVPDSDERDVVAVFADALEAFADACPGCLPETLAAAGRIIDSLFLSARAPLMEEAGTWFLRELRGSGVSLMRLLARQQPCAHQQLSAAYSESLGDGRSFATYLAALIERYRLVERLR